MLFLCSSVTQKEVWSLSLSFREVDVTSVHVKLSDGGVASVQKGVASKSVNPVNSIQ